MHEQWHVIQTTSPDHDKPQLLASALCITSALNQRDHLRDTVHTDRNTRLNIVTTEEARRLGVSV